MKNIIAELNKEFENLSALEVLSALKNRFNKIVFSTSFGKEDQVITDLIANNDFKVQIFTLDTGRLFEETYAVFNRTIEKYKLSIRTYYPNTSAIEDLMSEKGPYSFYKTIEDRKECCYIRKIEPLKRAIKGYEVWITGLRQKQSANRNEMQMVEWDEINKIIKVHPLFLWEEEKLNNYIDTNNVPINSLHKKGFPSIGCSPCTRAIIEGEDSRAGRWWWENSKKECGLHQIN